MVFYNQIKLQLKFFAHTYMLETKCIPTKKVLIPVLTHINYFLSKICVLTMAVTQQIKDHENGDILKITVM